jgi:hypothetical protein
MIAVVRVCWLFFSAFPVQRWLGVLGSALLAIGLGAALLGTDWRVSAMLGVIAFAVFVLFPAAVAAGGVLRALSAPHNHQFLPFFRVRVLLATALLMALLTAPFCFVVLGPAAPNGQVLPVEVIVLAFGALTAFVLSMFVISGQWNWMFPVLALFFVSSFWVNSGGPKRLLAAGLSPAVLVGAAAASAWLIFVIWYLRVRRVRPPMLTPAGRSSRQLGPSEVLPYATAARALLSGFIESPPTRVLLQVVGTGVAIGGAIALLTHLAKPPNKPPTLTAFFWPVVMMSVMAEGIYRLVRRSRLLWLHVPGSRADVLPIVEAAMAYRYLWTVALNVSMAAMVLGLQAASPPDVGWALALALSAALYGSYVGLAAVSGFGLLILGCLPMLIVQIAVLGTSGATGALGLTAMLALQLIGAGAFRWWGARRWRGIDWSRFRPLRDAVL